MRKPRAGLFAVVVVLLGATSVQVQSKPFVQKATLTVTPKTSTSKAPAGQKFVYAAGTYTLAPGQTVAKVVCRWYRQDKRNGNNLAYVGEITANAPAKGTYQTGGKGLAVATHDAQGDPIYYTAITLLFIVEKPDSVAAACAVNYAPYSVLLV